MEEYYKSKINESEVLQKVKSYLKLQNFSCSDNVCLQDNIKIMCVQKLCDVVGIKCKCNYKNKFFNYFSSITGEAVCQVLNIPISIASDNYRLFKYNHINLVEHVKQILIAEDLENAFVDIFQFLDDNKGAVIN